MSNLDVDMQAYRLTEEQKQAMHRMFKNESDAEDLLRMLGVIEDPKVVVTTRRQVSLKCVKHDENKHRTPAGKLVCNACRREQRKNRIRRKAL